MPNHIPPSPRSQEGLALFVALIVLVAMSIAGVALIRSVDTGTLIARNLAFQQSATLSGDQGIETARTWLLNNSSSLTGDRPGNGYYATSQDMLDLTGNVTPGDTSDNVNWDGQEAPPLPLAKPRTALATLSVMSSTACATPLVRWTRPLAPHGNSFVTTVAKRQAVAEVGIRILPGT